MLYSLLRMLRRTVFRLRTYRFWWQRGTRGWDDSDTWNLNNTMAHFILPRLKRFKEITICYPMNLTMEEWNAILDKMIFAFEYYHRDLLDDDRSIDVRQEEWVRVQEGLMLFGQYYNDLWW